MIIYYPDINLENFVYNQREKRIKIIDLEYMIIVERETFKQTNNSRSDRLGSQWCKRYRADFNIEQGISITMTLNNENEGFFSLWI